MENISHFQSLDELIKALDRERKLIQALFQDRKKLSFRVELAKEMASKREDSLDFMRKFGIIREVDDCVELEDVYLRFFEDVLVVNETINVASVRECIEALNDEIDFYLTEQNPNRKASYLKNVKRLLRNINLDTYRNVIDLSRNINNTYKNEPNFAIKKKKLENLDEKRKSIALLINECEKLIDERQITFFTIAMDVQLNQIVSDLKFRFREVYHNLLELNRTIITYLNLIEQQSRIFQKIQKVKYLRDQLLLETNTDIEALLSVRNPLWMEPRPRYILLPSLSMLRNTDEGVWVLQMVASMKEYMRTRKGLTAPPLTPEEMAEKTQELKVVDIEGVKNAFLASGDHLYHFLMNYTGYNIPMDVESKRELFCQIAVLYSNEVSFTNEYRTEGCYMYAVIVPSGMED